MSRSKFKSTFRKSVTFFYGRARVLNVKAYAFGYIKSWKFADFGFEPAGSGNQTAYQ